MITCKLLMWWEARDPALADDARRLAQFVSALPDFDPIYQSWLRSPKAKKPVLPVPLSEDEARQVLAENMFTYDDGRLWPELGSHIRAGNAGPPPHDFRKSSIASTECMIGNSKKTAHRLPNNMFMQLSKVRPSTGQPWRASELRPLMKFAREVWNPAEMCAMFSFYIRDLPSIPDLSPYGLKFAERLRMNPHFVAPKEARRNLEPWIGWITYLPADLASRAKYPADVDVETLGDGAALITLSEEPFDETDAEGMARLHALEAALRPIQT